MKANHQFVELKNISKKFGNIIALDNVSFSIEKGKIYGLLGGNGAGKTTLMNILSGLYKADKGEIRINGRKVKIASPVDALKYKISMVYQHFTLVSVFTAEENIILGTRIKKEPLLDLKEEEKKILRLMEEFKLKIDLKRKVNDLSVGDKQKVEILRALYRKSELLILDEPTTFLVPSEVDRLFNALRTIIKKEKISVIFITHKIEEAMTICEKIVVLREGHKVGTLDKRKASLKNLTNMMVGRSIDIEKSIIFSRRFPREKVSFKKGEPILTVRNLCVMKEGVPVVKNCSFNVFRGEIFGIAGITGNGQQELVEALMRLRKIESGKITSIKGNSTRDLLEGGIAYIPEDRIENGFLPLSTVAENLVLGYHKSDPFSKKFFLNLKAIQNNASGLISKFNIKTPNEKEIASRLSGGNIQKLLVSRIFSKQPKLIIAHNPTRGLDIPSTEFVLKEFLKQENKGVGILFISEDLNQLLLVSDRIGVIYKGEIVDVIEKEKFDKYKIGLGMLTGRKVRKSMPKSGC